MRDVAGTESSAEALFSANRQTLIARWPALWKRAQLAPAPGEWHWTDDTPSPTLQVEGIHLSSAYDRRLEALVQARLIPDASAEAWVYGVGAGELPKALLERAGLRRLFVVVLNAGIFLESCRFFSFEWLSDPRVELVLGEDERQVKKPFAALPACLRLAARGAAPLRDRVVLALSQPWIHSQHQAGMQGGTPVAGLSALVQIDQRQRIEDNLPFIRRDGDVSSLFKSLPGGTIVVAGAGPTLASHYEWLLETRDKFHLIAVDAALHPLLAAGLSPDAVVTLDPGEGVADFFEGDLCSLARVPLIYFPVVINEALKHWPGPRLTAYQDHPLYRQVAQTHPKGALFVAGSVIHPAVDLAYRMAPERIILIGADFAFPYGQSHAKNTPGAVPIAPSAGSAWLENGYGQQVHTLANLRGYMRDLEDYIAAHQDVAFFNSSLEGARIEGAPYVEKQGWYAH